MMRVIHFKIAGLLLLLLVALSAFAQPDKRVGIVYSEPSANLFYDKFAYSQLFMAMQHQAMMAGIPYDLLTEDDLTSVANLTAYDALLIPAMQYVTASKLTAIEETLNQAVFNYGMGLIVSGNLMTHSESGALLAGDPYSRMNQWLGLAYATSVNNAAMEIRAADISHSVMRDYAADELILDYQQIWFDSFQPLAAENASLLASLKVSGQSHNGVLATQAGGRNVHFANEQILADTNLVWPAIQWVMYGNEIPVGLKLSRQSSIFIARNDMDSSMYADELQLTDIPLYELLINWKAQFNFVGSYYLNIGNAPAAGEYTDWGISGPLFKNYLSLGNEIGSHSWSHPNMTSNLSSAELEFEFNQSRIELGSQLGIEVRGAAIPGDEESLEVDLQLEQYFDYVSGRSGVIDSGYPGAIGRMRPDSKMIYFSLNLSPDYTLIDYLGYSSAEAELIWQDEYHGLLRHASQPVIHWLWHDYGPTIETAGNYSVAMYDNTIAMAHANGSEFITLADLHDRISSHEAATLTVTGSNPITANVNASKVGQFSLMLRSDQRISQVSNWYAYDDDQVFLADNGGQFIIQMGDSQADVTRITALPMRARLMTLNGNGTDLSFSFEGADTVLVQLNAALAADLSVEGSDSFTQNGNQLTLSFNSYGL
ncbi:MAG: polysaccharide deacetylase family protein, partial [Gammaproteobacteria bacterium]|nr:polysaccharide deacetylase family protein [Gammaproteobacteria bacterium]